LKSLTGTSVEEDESDEGDNSTKDDKSVVTSLEGFISIFVLSLSGSDDVVSGEGGQTEGFSRNVAVRSCNIVWSHLIEGNSGDTSKASRSTYRSWFSTGKSSSDRWEDNRVLSVSVVSWSDEQETDQSSNSGITEDDERTSIVKVSDIINKETETEGPGEDEGENDHVIGQVEESDCLHGDSFSENSSGNSGRKRGNSHSP